MPERTLFLAILEIDDAVLMMPQPWVIGLLGRSGKTPAVRAFRTFNACEHARNTYTSSALFGHEKNRPISPGLPPG